MKIERNSFKYYGFQQVFLVSGLVKSCLLKGGLFRKRSFKRGPLVRGWRGRRIAMLVYAVFCVIRPLLGPADCRYPVSCMTYARIVLEDCSLPIALWCIVRRVVSCAGL